MSALFRDSQLAYGEKNVLGLLATRDLSESRRMKRQASESTTQSSAEEETDSSVMFEVKGKALLYSKSTPVLTVQKNSSTRTFNLERNPVITSDEKGDTFKIVLKYPSFTPEIGVSNKLRFKNFAASCHQHTFIFLFFLNSISSSISGTHQETGPLIRLNLMER